MNNKENIISFYYMPRNLSKYGAQFGVEYVPSFNGLEEYRTVFINKPDWCKDFACIFAGKDKHAIYNFTVKDIRFVSIEGVIMQALLHDIDKDIIDTYRDLEQKLAIIGVEQELAQSEGRWLRYMEENVESLESLKERGKDVTESN